jgi:hypothetical protein
MPRVPLRDIDEALKGSARSQGLGTRKIVSNAEFRVWSGLGLGKQYICTVPQLLHYTFPLTN